MYVLERAIFQQISSTEKQAVLFLKANSVNKQCMSSSMPIIEEFLDVKKLKMISAAPLWVSRQVFVAVCISITFEYKCWLTLTRDYMRSA